MSRMNTLLRASLEASQPVAPTDHMASLEAYVEYRIALEEYEEATTVQEQLTDLSEGLIEVEGLIDESRTNHELTEDQVELQVAAVNAVREVIDGDITEISMESFATIESASLEASDQSAGLLKRMWDAFVAMLKKIKEAFKKMWAWIFGSKKRTEEAVVAVKAAGAEVAGETVDKEDEKEVAAAKVTTQIAASAAKLDEASKDVETVVKDAKSIVGDISKAIAAKKPIAGDPNIKGEYDNLLNSLKLATMMADVITKNPDIKESDIPLPPEGFVEPSAAYTRIEKLLKSYSVSSGHAIETISQLDKTVEQLEVTFKGSISSSFTEEDRDEWLEHGRKAIAKIQRLRGLLVEYLKTGDKVVSKAKNDAVKTVSQARNKNKSNLKSPIASAITGKLNRKVRVGDNDDEGAFY